MSKQEKARGSFQGNKICCASLCSNLGLVQKLCLGDEEVAKWV